jgi:hypothetical protein
MLEARLAGHRSAIVWPEKTVSVPNDDPSFLIAYLPLEFAAKPKVGQETQANEILEKYGDKPRTNRNGVGLAVPSGDQVESLRRSVRYLVAIEQVKAKARQHNLTDEQRSQLRERESTEKAATESAFLKLYTEVWLPRLEGGAVGIETVSMGGRPLQTTLNEKKEAMIHERIMELLMDVQRRVFSTLSPGKIIELFKLGEGAAPKLGSRTSEIVDGFFSFLGFTRLVTSSVIRKAIAKGVQEGTFGYTSGAVPELGSDGKYLVPLAKVRIGTGVAEDEIDLESGFIMVPQAVPQPTPTPPPGLVLTSPVGAGPAVGPAGGGITAGVGPQPPGSAQQKVVQIEFSADRNQLFAAWNAVANLADLAGKVSVSVRADSENGFDRGKLQNGVLEPLKEANLID